MSTRQSHCSIRVSGQNPTPEQLRAQAYHMGEYPSQGNEGGFYEVKAMSFSEKHQEGPAMPANPKGSPLTIRFANNVSVTLETGFSSDDLWRCLSVLEASHVV